MPPAAPVPPDDVVTPKVAALPDVFEPPTVDDPTVLLPLSTVEVELPPLPELVGDAPPIPDAAGSPGDSLETQPVTAIAMDSEPARRQPEERLQKDRKRTSFIRRKVGSFKEVPTARQMDRTAALHLISSKPALEQRRLPANSLCKMGNAKASRSTMRVPCEPPCGHVPALVDWWD
jgi:hypothetical protein